MESLGQKLKKAREAKGITIEEMVKMTKISERNLASIEHDQFDDLPAPTYVKGFLKLYAQSVGLETREILEEFQKSRALETKQILILEGEKVNTPNPWAFLLTFLRRIEPKFWMGLGLLAVIIFAIFKSLHSSTPKEFISIDKGLEHGEESSASLIHPKSASSLISPAEKPAQSSPSPGAAESLILVGRVRQPVWLRVHCDDRLVFEGTLKRGAEETWRANEFFRLRIGNPDAIQFTLNGKDLGRVGGSGKIRDVRLTKDGWYVRD